MSAYDSPQLIAVNHVLLRLPVPRHSPCALLSLTFSTELPALHYVILFVCSQLEYFFMNSSILLPYFLTCMTFQDGCHTRLSLVCLFFVQFSRCVVQDQILNSDKYLIYLNSNFNLSSVIFLVTRSGVPPVRWYRQANVTL